MWPPVAHGVGVA
jgi:hypothetical protein